MAQTNTSTVYQKGDGSQATVTQVGDLNNSTVDQYGKNQAEVSQTGTDNDSDVDMGKSGFPQNNFDTDGPTGHHWGAFVTQDGEENSAKVEMYGSNGTATTYQEGDRNIAEQLIKTGSSGAIVGGRPGLDINQVGDDNEAYQETDPSFGTYGIQDMTILQTGNENFADQYSKGGMQGKMEVIQDGNYNNSTQYQDGNKAIAKADIVGDGNTTDQYQEYTVWGGGDNEANIIILGDDNNATQSQIGEANLSDITQTGNLNIASSTQTGDYHTSTITQFGGENTATVQQSEAP
jgi:hypothetical protein